MHEIYLHACRWLAPLRKDTIKDRTLFSANVVKLASDGHCNVLEAEMHNQHSQSKQYRFVQLVQQQVPKLWGAHAADAAKPSRTKVHSSFESFILGAGFQV